MSSSDESKTISDSSAGLQNTAAITYNTNSDQNLTSTTQPRPPRNFQDLLRYSSEAANALISATPARSELCLDEESRKFLEEAIKSVTVDVTEELLKSIRILKDSDLTSNDGVPQHCEEALDHILDYVDNIDIANDFHKIGGFCILSPCLESVHDNLRSKCAELIAELCQNNPYCQSKILEAKLMSRLLEMIDTDNNETVKVKSLYAVSCLARGSEEGFQEFMSFDGLSVLLRALQSNTKKLNIKAAFLVTSLCFSKSNIKDEIINMGYIEQIITQLAYQVNTFNKEDCSSVEQLLNALSAVVMGHSKARDICRKPELQLKTVLELLELNSKNNDQYLEEYECSKKLNQTIFGDSESSDEDR